MSVYVGTHHFHSPNSSQVNIPPFEMLSSESLAKALLPLEGYNHYLSNFYSATILIIGSSRDKLDSIPIARAYTTEFCREIVHRLRVSHNNDSINVSVTYKSELDTDALCLVLQIPKVQDGERLENNIIDNWFMIDDRKKLRFGILICTTSWQ